MEIIYIFHKALDELRTLLSRNPEDAGKVELAKEKVICIARGIDPKLRTLDCRTPLHFAAEFGDLESLTILLNREADIYASDKDENIPLVYAVNGGHIEIIKALLAKTDVSKLREIDMFRAVCYAALSRSREMFKVLIDAGFDVNATNNQGCTALMSAAGGSFNDIFALEILIAAGADVNARDQTGYTALQRAAVNTNGAAVKALVAAGADINARDNKGRDVVSRVPLMPLLLRHSEDMMFRISLLKAALDPLLDGGVTLSEVNKRRLEVGIYDIKKIEDFETFKQSYVARLSLKQAVQYCRDVWNSFYHNKGKLDAPRHVVLQSPSAAMLQYLPEFLRQCQGTINTVRIIGLSEKMAELLLQHLPARELAKLGLRNFIIEDLAHTQERYPDYYMASYVADKIKTDWELIPLNAYVVIANNLAFLSSDFSEGGIFEAARENFKAFETALAQRIKPDVKSLEIFCNNPEVLFQYMQKTTEGIRKVEAMSKPGIRVPAWASRLLELLYPTEALTKVSNAIFKLKTAKESTDEGVSKAKTSDGESLESPTLNTTAVIVTGGGGESSGTPDGRGVTVTGGAGGDDTPGSSWDTQQTCYRTPNPEQNSVTANVVLVSYILPITGGGEGSGTPDESTIAVSHADKVRQSQLNPHNSGRDGPGQ